MADEEEDFGVLNHRGSAERARRRRAAVLVLVLATAATVTGRASATEATASAAPEEASPGTTDASPGEPSILPYPVTEAGISGNPGAFNATTGTGWLGRTTGLDHLPGLDLGGVWIGDVNNLLDGGVDPGTTLDSLLILGLDLDLERALEIPGASFGAQFLQVNATDTNGDAGVVAGYNSIIAAPPFDRTELYQLWWRQELFDDLLILRVGKSVPSDDFGNVSRTVAVSGRSGSIPSVTGLIYTPIFTNPTTLGVLPGYYDSAYGITATVTPSDVFYTTFGVYDGNGARGVRTGERFVPQFTGYYFCAGEAGGAWLVGNDAKPGKFAAGAWLQTGELEANGIQENGTYGFYAYGSQRLWYRRPGVDNSGVSAFAQLAFNDSKTLTGDAFFGLGVTAFGLIPGRAQDSLGGGLAWSWLNTDLGYRGNELMLAAYYQVHLVGSIFFQPTFTYVPNPGQSPDVPSAIALTSRLTLLF